jgi:hypothetical protein
MPSYVVGQGGASEAADADATTARGPRHVLIEQNVPRGGCGSAFRKPTGATRAAGGLLQQHTLRAASTADYDHALTKACLEEKAVADFARKATHLMAPSMTQTALWIYATQIAAYPAGAGLHASMSSSRPRILRRGEGSGALGGVRGRSGAPRSGAPR